ncbi:MAG TPA: alkaline phosphatase family protein [Verrucomicrobiae bacterium]|nr:alkaline phosphatase family protein [Verrucomicrobiae bacterium]
MKRFAVGASVYPPITLVGIVFLLTGALTTIVSAQSRTIRVVSYNIEDDINGNTTPLAGLITPSSGGSVTNGGVLEGIGEEIIGGDPAQPIDILALEETTSNTITIQPIVNGLNTFYSVHNIPAGYAMSSYQATQSGSNGSGNGPNGLVYNTNTLQLIASVGVGTPTGSGNGEYRQEVRYEFAPAGVTPTTNNEFYVYVGHYKSGSTSGDATDRNGEAQIVRADVATLPGNSRVLFAGDFNTGNAGEAMYQTLVAAGVNQAFDVLNPTGSSASNFDGSGDVQNLTESAPDLRYRDDYQMMTSNVLYGVAGGLAYVSGTYHAFGNNGTTPYQGSVNSGSDTALNTDLNTNGVGITASQLYQYLTTGSDHLPVVADYTLSSPATTLQSIQTVFIILEENENWASISGNAAAPYINNGLLPKASYTLQYYNPPGLHPSLPNYLWLEAGTNFGVTADGDPSQYSQTSTNHLVTLLKNAGVSWTSYQEDISGSVCPLTSVNQYAPKHNPMVFFDDVTSTNNSSSAYCIANVRPFTELAGDLQSNVVTRYNFITPNLCDDMHGNTGCLTGNALITQADTWLSNTVATIVSSQAYSNNGAIFVTWDEGEGGDGPIGMIVLSPLARGGGYANTIHYTHSSTLLTMQEIFNVGPLLGDATNATDLSDLFVFGAQLAVSPASGFSSSGGQGGPFSPANQVYTLSNTGGVAMTWSAATTVNWVSLSVTNGTLAGSSSTNITVSVNANANSLSSGSYSGVVSFATSNGSGSASEPVNLTVTSPTALLSVTPSSGFVSAGPPGGPFSPISQTYTLSNIGGVPMSWTANNTASWLTVSPTSGTLASGASTNVTAAINANANSLPVGGYSDTISFTNTTNGAGNTTRSVTLSMFGFYDDFSTFASGNLAGQSSWTQLGTISSSAIQITTGQAGFAGGLTASGQTACKNFGITNETVFYGLTLTVTNAPNTNSTSFYLASLYSSSNGTGNAGFHLVAESPNSARTNFVLGVKVTPAANDPIVFGATGLTYGTQYRVIVEATAGGTNAILYVNPTSGTLGAQTPYAKDTVATGVSPVGSVAIAQLGNATVPTSGGLIGKFVVADNFGVAYNDLLTVAAPTATFTASPTNGPAPLNVSFTDTSSGTPTSWAWTFGDGGTSTLQNPNYTYAAPGTYTVTLIASNAGGSGTNVQVNYITALTAFQAWQSQYFGGATNPLAAAAADPFGKGISNTNQFLMGLNPTNPASIFRIVSVTTTGADVVVTWQTSGGDASGLFGSGKTNVLLVTPGLPDGSYSNSFVTTGLTNVITTLGDVITNAVDAGGATNGPSRYYQIQFISP